MALMELLTIAPSSSLDTIEIQASLQEIHSDALQTTDHPVERSADITDHAFKRPAEVMLHCGWSSSSSEALVGAAVALFSGGSPTSADYIDSVYSQLLALQESRVPFSITTTRRQYDDMLLIGLQVTTDNRTSNALMVTATCKQIIIVDTQVSTMPPKANQANPASTAEIENAGVKQPQTGATPSPSGAAPPETWGNEARR